MKERNVNLEKGNKWKKENTFNVYKISQMKFDFFKMLKKLIIEIKNKIYKKFKKEANFVSAQLMSW